MFHARTWLLCSLLAATMACDELVTEGEVTVLGDRASVLGVENPNAAFVFPGGTLIVDDADLTGRGERVDVLPPGAFPTPGAAIVSAGGTVRIRNGRIAGGNVLVTLGDPSALPRAPIPGPNTLAPALIAAASTVEISGGTLTSSGVFGDSLDPYQPGTTMVVVESDVRISGGEFLNGPRSPDRVVPFDVSFDAARSNVEITGGRFGFGLARIASSRTRISGGSFALGLGLGGDTPSGPPGCTEVTGGVFGFGIDVRGAGEKLVLFGTSFGRPFGPVRITAPPGSSEAIILSGTRLDGSPLRVDVFAQSGTQVILAAPGDSGCS